MNEDIRIERIGYCYPNLIFSLNGQTFLLRVKPGRGNKWLKSGMIESVSVYPTIENDMSQFQQIPSRNIEKFILTVLNNFPTRLDNTNEPARNFIWGWRKGVYKDKTGKIG